MIRLMMLRHAKSSRPPAMADCQRPLSDRGEVAAALMGEYMAHHGLIPDKVLCSSARRTLDTWSGVSAKWPPVRDVVFEDRLYGAGRAEILSIVRAEQDTARSLLVIGHNPGLHEAADSLIATGDVDERERLREKFPTAALAVIDFALERWDGIHEHSGRFDRFITPRAVAAATS